jgi:transcriptional regulator with XRE-family HTH domain
VTAQDAPVQRRRLRTELRRMREAAHLTQGEVASAMDWSLSKVIRFESGLIGISISDLRAVLQYYGANDPQEIDRLVAMARASRGSGWWAVYREVTSQQYTTYLGYENSATIIHQFEPSVVPELLQDEDYARAVLRVVDGANSQRLEELIDLRMRRQEEIFERPNPPEMNFLVDEAVLHRSVGGNDVTRRQLLRLKEIADRRDNVTIQVVPFRAGAHPGIYGSFGVLEFADDEDEDILFVKNWRGDVILHDGQTEIESAHQTLAQLRDLAVDASMSIDEALARLE